MIEASHAFAILQDSPYSLILLLKYQISDRDPWPDGDKDHHEHSHENHLGGAFDQAAEDMIKKVKQALSNGEGCRVFHHGAICLLC